MIKSVLGAALLAASAMTQAASLSGVYTVDDYATVYLSTDLLVDDSEIISDKPLTFGNSSIPVGWMSTASFSDVTLDAGQSYYLLVHAQNYDLGQRANPAMFLGEFEISGDGFSFSNGTQRLLTNTTDWSVSEAEFSDSVLTPVSEGANTGWYGVGFADIARDAEMIWPYEANFTTGYSGSAYFVTQIVAVPEPETYAMFVAGVALLSCIARRRRR